MAENTAFVPIEGHELTIRYSRQVASRRKRCAFCRIRPGHSDNLELIEVTERAQGIPKTSRLARQAFAKLRTALLTGTASCGKCINRFVDEQNRCCREQGIRF